MRSEIFRTMKLRSSAAFMRTSVGYGQTESLMDTLEEASRLLNGYARAILASGS